MNPAAFAVVAEWQAHLDRKTAQVQSLLAESGPGCRDLIDRSPADPGPLARALLAIAHQLRSVSEEFEPARSAFTDRTREAGGGSEGVDAVDSRLRWTRLRVDELSLSWELHWRVEQVKAMEPAARAAAEKLVPCAWCGAPLKLASRHHAQTAPCSTCRVENHVAPDPLCESYVGMAHLVGMASSLRERFAVARADCEWEERSHAEYHRTGRWPDQPLVWLEQRERLELAYWTSYVGARCAMDPWPPELRKELVDAKMRAFFDDRSRREAWQKASAPSLEARLRAYAGVPGGPLAPVEGVGVETYARLIAAAQKRESAGLFASLLAEAGMDRARWERVSRGWYVRITYVDETGAAAKAYSSALPPAEKGPQGEIVPLEKYAEISAATSAWAKQGKDIDGGLRDRFGVAPESVQGFYVYWAGRMAQEPALVERFQALYARYEAEYGAMA